MQTTLQDIYAATLAPMGNGAAILILTTNDTEDLEFFYPYYRFTEAGYRVDVTTPTGGSFRGKHGLGLKNTKAISDVRARNYALLYIPGGKAPEALKHDKAALALVQRFSQEGKPIAAICHGAQLLAAARLIEGRHIAAWPEVAQEVEDTGGTYCDEAAVIDGPFITARRPGDLPGHLARTLEVLEQSTEKMETRRALSA